MVKAQCFKTVGFARVTRYGYEISLLSADNAALLIALTANSSEVWILPNTDIDALPIMLWKEARWAVLGLGLLALLWLWSLYNRLAKCLFCQPTTIRISCAIFVK